MSKISLNGCNFIYSEGQKSHVIILFIVYYDQLSFITPAFCTNSCAKFARNYGYNTVITVYGCVYTISNSDGAEPTEKTHFSN